MALIAAQLRAGFSLFKRPLGYLRDDQQLTVKGYVGESAVEQPLVGDIGQMESTVTFDVEDLKAQGLFPPLKYDKIIYHGASHSITDSPKIQYDGDEPVFVRLRCLG